MDNTNYKKKGILLFLLFAVAFTLIMFLPNIRTAIMEKQYEKEHHKKAEQVAEEETEQKKHESVSTMICSLDIVSYSFYYKSSGLQKYSKTETIEISEEEKDEQLEICKKEQEDNNKGVETKCEINNGLLVKAVIYDFTTMNTQYRKDNIFEFAYNSSVETIKTDLTKKGYTCG